MPRSVWITLSLFHLCATCGISQHFRFLQISNSTMPDGVNCVSTMEDSYGHIWFATYNGAVRFDGANMTYFQTNPDDSTTINHNIVQHFLQDGEYVYATTWGNGGVLNQISLIDHSLKRIKFKNDPNGAHSSFLKLKNGGRVVGGEIGPLYISEDWSKTSSIEMAFAIPLAQEENNQILISTKDRLLTYQVIHDSLHLITSQGTGRRITSTERISGTRVYGSDNGLFSFDPMFTIPTSLQHLNINDLLLDSFHRLWIATKAEGLYLWHIGSGRVEHFLAGDKEGMLPTNTIIGLLEDRNKLLWISTPAGPLYTDLNNNLIDNVSFPDNTTFVNSGGYGIFGDTSGVLWIGTNQGILLYNRKTYRFLESGIPILNARQVVPLPAKNETYFIASNGFGAYVIERDPISKAFKVVTHFSHRPGQTGLSSNFIMSILKDHQGNYWFGTFDNGIDILQPSGQWRHLNKHDLDGVAISSLLLSKDSSIWVSKWDNGISKANIDEKGAIHFKHFSPTTSSLRYHAIANLTEDSEETLWIATMGGGVYSLQKDTEKFVRYAAPEGLTSTNIFAIEMDKKDNVWCSTSDGIGFLMKGKKKFRMYRKSDGLHQNAFTFFANHAMPDGCLSFGTLNGIAIISPENLKRDNKGNPPTISRIKIFNEFLVPGDASPINQNPNLVNSLRLTYEQDLLTFIFTNNHYADPGRVMYGYFLEGFNRDWVELGKSNVATFTRLPPGTYKLNYRSSIDDGDTYSYAALPLEIIILPPWWQRWWFKGLVTGIVLILFYFIGRQRTQHLLALQRIDIEKRLAVETERSRISRDMHDDLGSGLSAIHLMSNYLKENTSKHYPEFSEDIEKIRKSSEELNQRIREIIWTVNAKDDTLESLVIFLLRFAGEMSEQSQVPIHVLTPDTVPDIPLNGLQRKHLFLAAKEAVNNALKHGHPTQIDIVIQAGPGKEIAIVVKDDGQGFNPEHANVNSSGNGMSNMKYRMSEIGGTMEMYSSGEGTSVCFYVKA